MSAFLDQLTNLFLFMVGAYFVVMLIVFATSIKSQKRSHRNEERARQDYYDRRDRWRNERK